MNKSVFEFLHYRAYLRGRLEAAGARGNKGLIAEAMSVQPTYVSQVLQEKAHLSLEQAEACNSFLAHTTQESHYFLLLVQFDRSGTKSLRDYFKKQIDDVLKARLILTERLGKSQQVEDVDRSWYYSSWIPAAVHVATTIPTLRLLSSISVALQLSQEKTLETLEKLESMGLVQKKGQEFHPGQARVRLGNDSHYIIKHHTNWRLKAMQGLEQEKINELHYSGVVSLSSADVLKIKDILLDAIKQNIEIVKESKEEELFCMAIDFFDLKRSY